MNRWMGLAVVWVLGGCGGSDAPFADCDIGGLTGTWRFHYDETNGNCGAIADETVALSSSAPSSCTTNSSSVSGDKCELQDDFTCPLTSGTGSQRWVEVIDQASATEMDGTATVQLVDDAGDTCRSTYNVTVTKL